MTSFALQIPLNGFSAHREFPREAAARVEGKIGERQRAVVHRQHPESPVILPCSRLQLRHVTPGGRSGRRVVHAVQRVPKCTVQVPVEVRTHTCQERTSGSEAFGFRQGFSRVKDQDYLKLKTRVMYSSRPGLFMVQDQDSLHSVSKSAPHRDQSFFHHFSTM